MKKLKKEEIIKTVEKANESLDKIKSLWGKAKQQIKEKSKEGKKND